MCAKYNMQIVNCTTPANFYHLIRRQLKRNYRKPLFVFTPKSLLRHPQCRSSVSDLVNGCFETVIDDTQSLNLIDKLVFCSGKIYFELLNRKQNLAANHIAIIRIEQLFPLNIEKIKKILNKYDYKELIWVQEEPQNMGAWSYILQELREYDIQVIARKFSAATASGSSKKSNIQQEEIINKVFL